MKNIISLFFAGILIIPAAFGQIKAKGTFIGVSLGRPYLIGQKEEAPSNFSQVFLGYRFNCIGSIFSLTPKLSVQRNLITTNKYFEQVGSDYYFREAPGIYLNNRLMTFVATFGLGLSVHRTIAKQTELELTMEPQIGKNVVNNQLYYKDGESQKRSVSNNPLVTGGEISIWIKKKNSCGGTLMIGPGVVLQNGNYVKGDNFRSVMPMFSLAALL